MSCFCSVFFLVVKEVFIVLNLVGLRVLVVVVTMWFAGAFIIDVLVCVCVVVVFGFCVNVCNL